MADPVAEPARLSVGFGDPEDQASVGIGSYHRASDDVDVRQRCQWGSVLHEQNILLGHVE